MIKVLDMGLPPHLLITHLSIPYLPSHTHPATLSFTHLLTYYSPSLPPSPTPECQGRHSRVSIHPPLPPVEVSQEWIAVTSPLPPVPILIALQAPDKEGLWGLDQEVPGVSAQGLPGKMVDLLGILVAAVFGYFEG